MKDLYAAFFLSLVTFSLTRLFLGAFLEKCAQDTCKSLPPFLLLLLLYVEFRSAWQLFYLYTWIQLKIFQKKKKKKKQTVWSVHLSLLISCIFWAWCQNGWIRISHYACSQTTLQLCFLAFSFMHLQGSQLSSLHLMQIKILLSSALCTRHKWCSTKLSNYILHYLHILVFLH